MVDRYNRRRFLKQSFAFSALTAGTAVLGGCGSGSTAGFSDDPTSLHLSIVGDWGEDTTTVPQQAVSTGLQTYLRNRQITSSYMLLLGDNFYGPLSGVDDPRWQAQFEDMYPAAVFPNACWAVLGNHEYQNRYRGKMEAELAYGTSRPTRWSMPNHFYRVDLPASDPFATFYFLDSNVLPLDGHVPPGFFVMDPTLEQQQYAWLTRELALPKAAPFRIVVAHHPLYSNGPHGNNEALIRDWDPLFRKYGVDLYLAGHDHDLQHLEFAGHPTSFVSSGAGGAQLYPLATPQGERGPFAASVYGSTLMTLAPDQLSIRHLDSTGAVIHAFRRSADGAIHLLS